MAQLTPLPSTYLDECCQKELTSKISPSLSDLTCCLLTVSSFDVDIITTDVHPVYTFKTNLNEGEQTELPDLNDPEVLLNMSFPSVIWNQRADWEISVKSITVIPIAVTAILANLAVIRIILKARLTRNPINLFILNMSIADLLCALLFPWIILVSDLSQSFLLGNCICRTEGFVLLTLMLTSVLSLTVISYDRLTAVVFPFKKRMDREKSKIIIFTLWVISMVCACPLIIWRSYHERIWMDFHEKWCTEDSTKLKLYWLALLIILVWIPLAVLIISYTAIVYKLDSLEKRQKEHPAQVKIKSRVIRMLFSIVLIFTFCWTPFSVFIILRNDLPVGKRIPTSIRNLMFVSHYLMFVNSAVNPIIYGLKNDNLKKEIRLALPAFMRPKNTCEISAVWQVRGHLNGNGNGGKMGRREKQINLWSNTSSCDDHSPASIVSLKQSSSALEDIGINISSMTKVTVPD